MNNFWGVTIAVVAVLMIVWLYRRFRDRTHEWKATRRAELIAYLKRHQPQVKVREEHEDQLKLDTVSEGKPTPITLNLENIYRLLVRLDADDQENREAVYQTVVHSLNDALRASESEAGDRHNLMPRIISEAKLANLREALGDVFPLRRVGDTGLHTVMVLDRPTTAAYITRDMLQKIGLEETEAFDIAIEHLRRNWKCDPVRNAAEGRAMAVVKGVDTYDAARLLLVPECLQDGETVVALIPDRDTLTLLPPPKDNDWQAVHKLAANAVAERLCNRPVLVTSAGFTLVEPEA